MMADKEGRLLLITTLALLGFLAQQTLAQTSNGPLPRLEPAEPAWQSLDKGFEIAEPSVMAGARRIGRLLLARIDPARYEFAVRNDPAGKPMSEWLTELGAVMVVNGSFFLADGTPATPILSSGVRYGPKSYTARHGAFLVTPHFVGIRDLRKTSWQEAFEGAREGTVSFPLLLAADGGNAAPASEKSADRSFVAQDASGRIIFGASEAFFTLSDFAALLKSEALALTAALNLDGGPYGCQAIALKDYARSFCGYNAPPGGDPADRPPFGPGDQGRRLPIVLSVKPK